MVQVVSLADAPRRPRHAALGQFDGVHLGHREVIRGMDTVVTFDPHPQVTLTPDRPLTLLTPLDRKIELIAALGVREVVLIRFDADRARQAPANFIEEVLVKRLQVSELRVGEGFRFGARASGDTALLARDARFATRVVALVQRGGEPVSSSHIRRLLAAGDIAEATRLLGSPVYVRAEVQGLDRRRRAAGLRLSEGPAVAPGRYACETSAGPATLLVHPAASGHAHEGWLLGLRPAPGEEIGLELVDRLSDASSASASERRRASLG